ncbi:hypothetical protein EJ05DRAFT_477813, partial [Pseudovirgaria hyperparasitica]
MYDTRQAMQCASRPCARRTLVVAPTSTTAYTGSLHGIIRALLRSHKLRKPSSKSVCIALGERFFLHVRYILFQLDTDLPKLQGHLSLSSGSFQVCTFTVKLTIAMPLPAFKWQRPYLVHHQVAIESLYSPCCRDF